MVWKPAILAVALATSLVATPALAALQNLNFTGRWLVIDLASAYAPADAITLHVTYDDTALLNGFTDRYDLTAAGSELTLTAGDQVWTLADYFASFQPVPFVDFAPPTGPDVFFLGINADFSAVVSGIGLVQSYDPGTILFSPKNAAFDTFSSVATFLPAGPSVPEPAAWAMLITGFGLTGAAMRRSRLAIAA